MQSRKPFSPVWRGGVQATLIAVAAIVALAIGASSAFAASRPSVTNVAPATGPVSGGTELHIGGSNFSGATEVRFGSIPASFSVKSSIRIDTIAPPGVEGTVDVTVITPEGTSEITRADHFSYVPPGPSVVEVRPNEGPVSGGQSVKIYGAHLEDVMEVNFGGVSTPFEVVSPEQVNVTAPVGYSPTEDVRVTTLEGTSPIVTADQYHYEIRAAEISGVLPNFGAAAGGTKATIDGEEFYGVTAVYFGGTEAVSYTVNSPTSITAVAPPSTAGQTHITVFTVRGASLPEYCRRNKGKRGQCTPAGAFKYKEPTVTGITPEDGPIGGGTSFTLTGTGFAVGSSGTAIVLGKGVATSVDCTSVTTCTGVTPPAAKRSTAYVKATIVNNGEKAKTKKNKSVAFHYE
jgi:IPT/TIG domain